jgi:hypothetical protein
MSEYLKSRQGIWMIQVRKKGSNKIWSVTGAHWFHDRAAAIREIKTIPWKQYEYRAVRYMPAEKK